MLEQDLLKYCFYYKGEVLCPFSNEQKNECRLWSAEKIICEEFPFLVDENNTQKQMASLIASYVGKWSPYKFHETMSAYFKNIPSLKSEIMSVYN